MTPAWNCLKYIKIWNMTFIETWIWRSSRCSSYLALHQLLKCEACQTAEGLIAEGIQIEFPASSGKSPSPLISFINIAAEVSPLAAFCMKNSSPRRNEWFRLGLLFYNIYGLMPFLFRFCCSRFQQNMNATWPSFTGKDIYKDSSESLRYMIYYTTTWDSWRSVWLWNEKYCF